MHVLTKIFIVLVSLLAVMLVPLVVVYAHNENSYKGRLVSAEESAASARMAMSSAEARHAAEKQRLEASIAELSTSNRTLGEDGAAKEATIRQLESQVATNAAAHADVSTRIANIEASISAGQQLTETLVGELRELRALAVNLERQKVELDEALREVTAQLDIAETARRALTEELDRLKREHAGTLTDLGRAIAMGFDPGKTNTAAMGLIPDRTLTATIVSIQRSNNQVLAEIDAGQRDGVKKDWIMTIGDDTGKFIGNLRIINVDINRATGVVTLEQGKNAVQVGQRAVALAGRE